MESALFAKILLYLAAAIIAVTMFRFMRMGAILGYLFAGVVLGPSGLHWIDDPYHTMHFAELGVVMLLFVIGLELNPDKLWRMRSHILLLGLGQLLGTALILTLLLIGFGLTPQLALLLGLTLGLSSTAFAVQLMNEQNIMGLAIGRKGFAILLLQDMAVIPILLLVGLFAAADIAGKTPWWSGPLAVITVLVVGRFAINPLLRAVASVGVREILLATTLFIVLGTAYLMQAAGLTMGMGAFLAGIILGNSSFRHQLEADIEPFKGLLMGLFFIAVGMNLNLSLLLSEPLVILAGAVGLMAIKMLVIAGLIRLSRASWRDAALLGVMLAQGGEFAFVVMGKSAASGLLDAATVDRVTLLVGVSMALTAPLVSLCKHLTRPRSNAAEGASENITNEQPEVIIAGFGRFGQITGRLLTANRLSFTALDKSAEHVEFVKRFGNRVFFGDAARLELLQAAGIDQARILVVAVDDPADSVAIAAQVRHLYPKITIIARARDRGHAYRLLELDVHHVIRETFESSLVAASHTLSALGFTTSQTRQLIDIFRRHDREMLLKAVDHKDNLERLIQISDEGRRELESLFDEDKAR